MMDVKKINIKTFFIVLMSFLSFSACAKNTPSNNQIINVLHNNVAKSTVNLGNKIEDCNNVRLEAEVATLDSEYLKSLNATKKDVIIAITHISFNNTYVCEKSARIELAYNMGLLISVKRQLQSNIKELDEIENNLIYPPIKQIRLSIKYFNLSKKLKNYIKRRVGSKPFNLIKTLEKYNLLEI